MEISRAAGAVAAAWLIGQGAAPNSHPQP